MINGQIEFQFGCAVRGFEPAHDIILGLDRFEFLRVTSRIEFATSVSSRVESDSILTRIQLDFRLDFFST